MLGCKELTIDQALEDPDGDGEESGLPHPGSAQIEADFATLPPQIGPVVDDTDASYVTYISPAALRSSLERHVDERGEEVLERDNLRAIDPELFYNFLWYCARFSLPLPLPVSSSTSTSSSLGSPMSNDGTPKHICALAAWYVHAYLRTKKKRGKKSSGTFAFLFFEHDGPNKQTKNFVFSCFRFFSNFSIFSVIDCLHIRFISFFIEQGS